VYPMMHLSQFPKASVASSQPPFGVGSRNLHLEEGIAVGVAQNKLGRSLALSCL
jgi:hypothetical protein